MDGESNDSVVDAANREDVLKITTRRVIAAQVTAVTVSCQTFPAATSVFFV